MPQGLSVLGLLEEEDQDESDNFWRGRHARWQDSKSMPTYHEDFGEYISGATIEEKEVFVKTPVIVVPEIDQSALDLHNTEPLAPVEEEQDLPGEELDGEDLPTLEVAVENATKKDIKAYLCANTFKCVSASDPEKLSEFAYTPTDKGLILSVKNPFGNTNFKRMKGLLRRRVKPSRYVHCVMVADTAEKMALAYGVDARVARMAGLLHDWDKALSPKRLRDRVAHYGLDIDGSTQINMPQLLHGPTAAAVLADEFPEFGAEVFQAIERHTVGGLPMTPLDMIVFSADKIEPSHDVKAYRDLYDQIGQISLKELFLSVQREGLEYLLRSNRPLDINAVEVWNFYSAEQQRDRD